MNKPWKTKKTYWEIETGIKLTEPQVKKHYIIIETKKIIYNGQYYNTREKQHYCTKEQLRLF